MTAAALRHSGTHLIADLHGVARGKLCDAGAIDALLRQAAAAAGATIVYSHFHAFGPGQGITGVVLLAESHISIHTWPELGFAALDIFMCGQAEPRRALALIEASLAPVSSAIQELPRGYSVAAQ
ncbi:MAG TPA: adenosylmethionine decarboxylase [Oxalobacteraceae bacterium]|nr:adenosylmethionine decarboxylase [Oxalobacteraceae bacterium]